MPVSIVRQGNIQNSSSTNIDTTGGQWVIWLARAPSWWGTVKLGGNSPDHDQSLASGANHDTRVCMWRTPTIGSSVALANEYNTDLDGTYYVLADCIDWDYQSKYNTGAYQQVTTSKVMSTGYAFAIGMTGRSGYSITSDSGQTTDYNINFRTYQARIDKYQYSTAMGFSYTSSGTDDKIQAYFITGALSRTFDVPNPIVGLFEKMKRRTKLYQDLLNRGAIDLNGRRLQPI